MNGLDDEQMTPQTFLYGCVLKAGKEVVFNPEDDDFEHQLDLRMVCVDTSTKDELHMVEVEGQNSEGQKVTAVLASIKPSTMPSACLGGFTITPPAVFRLKTGAGPVHISGQHLVMMGGDQSFDDDDDEEEEEESVKTNKRPASMPSQQPQKKLKKMEDDEEDGDDEDDDEYEEEEESPVKVKSTPSKPKAASQNGKNVKVSTPAPKEVKTPQKAIKTPKAPTPKPQTPQAKTPKPQTPQAKTPKPQTPKAQLTIAEIKEKMVESKKKGVALPKQYNKFENFVKNCFKVSEQKAIMDLWKWRQSVPDSQ